MAAARARLLDRSRVVAVAKLVLPLAALALMSMVFLLADPVDPGRAIDSADIDVESRARDPRVSGARFAGVTEDGAALRIEAATARSDPGASLRFQLQDFALWLDAADGSRLTARATSGQIDRGRGTFALEGGLRIVTEPGYDLTASAMQGQLDRTRIQVTGPIAGQAPAGRITAGSLSVLPGPPGPDGAPAGQRLVFREGVSLIYAPDE